MSGTAKRRRSEVGAEKRRARDSVPLQVKRHCETLSLEETDELVETVAIMIVEHIKARGKLPACKMGEPAGSEAHEAG